MKKSIYLSALLSTLSFASGNFSYEINMVKNFDYNTKATFKDSKWIYNPKYEYNKYNSTYQLANIKGDFTFNNGIYFKYNLQSPIKLDKFDGEEDKKKAQSKKARSHLNPNLTHKPNFDFTIGHNKTYFIDNDLTINNNTNFKYILSTFKGLESVDQNQLDINEDFSVYNKYVNFNTNINYSSINLIKPIEYSLAFAFDKNIYDSNIKLKFKLNQKLEENIIKNKIIDMVSYMDTTPHEHSGEKTPFYVQERLEGHQRRNNNTNFGENFSAKYIIPEVSVEYSKKLNKYFLLNASNNFKYSILRYQGNAEDILYKSKLDLVENQTKLNLRYSTGNIKNISEADLKYTRSLHTNNYTKDFDKNGFNFINIINEKKRNYQEFNLGLSDKFLYEINLTDKLTITPRIFMKYQFNAKSYIFTDEDKKDINSIIAKHNKEIEEYKEEYKNEKNEDDKQLWIDEIESTEKNIKVYQKELDLQKYKLSHSLVVEPGVFVDYKFNNNLKVYTSLDMPFIFKTRNEKNLGIKKQLFEQVEYQKIQKENVFLPNNFNIKLGLGMKYTF